MHSSKCVAVIEDDDCVRRVLTSVLGHYYEVVSAPDGESGLRLVNDTHPAIVFCEAHMSGLNGFEVVNRLKDAHTDARLVMSGWSDEKELAFALGADAFVSKPIHLPDLVATIEHLASNRGTSTH